MEQFVLRLIEEYIGSKKRAWSETTLRSDRHRLRGMAGALDGDPDRLWKHLEAEEIAPYSRVTYWTRAASFWQWAIENKRVKSERNLYSEFRRDNARLFKNTYQRSVPKLTLAEARAKIAGIANAEARALADELLDTGMRWIDANRRDGEVVEGKGGKRRRVAIRLVNERPVTISYRTFLRALAEVGLKPHDIRKIFATHLHKKGFSIIDMCLAMGWAKPDTALSYVRAADEDELMASIKNAIGE